MAPGSASKGGKYTALLTLGALGVVYGDIGTSPRYPFRVAFHVAGLSLTEHAIFGVLSLIFWGLVLVVTARDRTIAVGVQVEI